MNVRVRDDSVEIEGYVNAIERNSKPLMSRIGKFIERICKGAFSKALQRNDDVHILLNHDWNRDLGSTKQGNLELNEDNIGLHARAVITDRDVVEKAKNGDLVGWSFGFQDRDVDQTVEKGYPCREVKDLDLFEVSILDRTKTPAYDGTLLMARSEDDVEYRSEPFLDGINITVDVSFTQKDVVEIPDETEEVKEEVTEEVTEEIPDAEQETREVDYSVYERMIDEMKQRYNPNRDPDGKFGSGSGGSSGGSSGKSGKSSDSSSDWDYRGFRDQAKKLQDAMDKANTPSRVQQIAKSANDLIKSIDKEMENPEGNVTRLKMAKWQANQVIKQAEKFFNG